VASKVFPVVVRRAVTVTPGITALVASVMFR
jgi:hypothetical protein